MGPNPSTPGKLHFHKTNSCTKNFRSRDCQKDCRVMGFQDEKEYIRQEQLEHEERILLPLAFGKGKGGYSSCTEHGLSKLYLRNR